MTVPTPSSVSQSGITTDSVTGERYIPSSVRADGSKRKEIKVRPGYQPPEDVKLYKTRAAEAWKNRGKAGVPGAVPGADGLKENEATKSGTGSAASNKNAKRREAKKKAKATSGEDGNGTATQNGRDVSQLENWRSGASGGDKKQSDGAEAPAAPVDPEAEKEKKARNLKKKLKQARELSDKKNNGEALLPEQFEKVIKINELIRQLEALGFDANGDKKEAQEEKPEK
ncbi:hypothetical protein BDV18DRAFT_128168 [Aspergillus unguis]